jgi:hypothetical protein
MSTKQMTADENTGSLTLAQVKAAREAGPKMLEVLCGWISAEQTLTGTTSFRRKLDAARNLAGLHNSAEALVTRVLEATDNG